MKRVRGIWGGGTGFTHPADTEQPHVPTDSLNICLLSCSMLRYVHRLAAHADCFLFGVGQEAHSRSIGDVSVETAALCC